MEADGGAQQAPRPMTTALAKIVAPFVFIKEALKRRVGKLKRRKRTTASSAAAAGAPLPQGRATSAKRQRDKPNQRANVAEALEREMLMYNAGCSNVWHAVEDYLGNKSWVNDATGKKVKTAPKSATIIDIQVPKDDEALTKRLKYLEERPPRLYEAEARQLMMLSENMSIHRAREMAAGLGARQIAGANVTSLDDLLDIVGLETWKKKFAYEGLDLTTIFFVTEVDLQGLGLTIGNRIRLLQVLRCMRRVPVELAGAAATAVPRRTKFIKDDIVERMKKIDDGDGEIKYLVQVGKIVAVHEGDPEGVYYTVDINDNEAQCSEDKLAFRGYWKPLLVSQGLTVIDSREGEVNIPVEELEVAADEAEDDGAEEDDDDDDDVDGEEEDDDGALLVRGVSGRGPPPALPESASNPFDDLSDAEPASGEEHAGAIAAAAVGVVAAAGAVAVLANGENDENTDGEEATDQAAAEEEAETEEEAAEPSGMDAPPPVPVAQRGSIVSEASLIAEEEPQDIVEDEDEDEKEEEEPAESGLGAPPPLPLAAAAAAADEEEEDEPAEESGLGAPPPAPAEQHRDTTVSEVSFAHEAEPEDVADDVALAEDGVGVGVDDDDNGGVDDDEEAEEVERSRTPPPAAPPQRPSVVSLVSSEPLEEEEMLEDDDEEEPEDEPRTPPPAVPAAQRPSVVSLVSSEPLIEEQEEEMLEDDDEPRSPPPAAPPQAHADDNARSTTPQPQVEEEPVIPQRTRADRHSVVSTMSNVSEEPFMAAEGEDLDQHMEDLNDFEPEMMQEDIVLEDDFVDDEPGSPAAPEPTAEAAAGDFPFKRGFVPAPTPYQPPPPAPPPVPPKPAVVSRYSLDGKTATNGVKRRFSGSGE